MSLVTVGMRFEMTKMTVIYRHFNVMMVIRKGLTPG